MYTLSYTHTPPTQIYTLSLHDALPISHRLEELHVEAIRERERWRIPHVREPHRSDRGGLLVRHRLRGQLGLRGVGKDRKSTRLNSSHITISYAVFCLKKKKQTNTHYQS